MSEKALRELRAVRERYERDVRVLVSKAATAGVRSHDIAEALGVSRATLWRRYREQLRVASARRWGGARRASRARRSPAR